MSLWDILFVIRIVRCQDAENSDLPIPIVVPSLQAWKTNNLTDTFERKALFNVISLGTALQQTTKVVNNSVC